MTLRSQFDEIYNSIVNGQFRQAVNQMDNVGMNELSNLLDYFVDDLDQPEMAIKASKLYFRIKSI